MGIKNVETKLEAIKKQIQEAILLSWERDVDEVGNSLDEIEDILVDVKNVLDEILEKKDFDEYLVESVDQTLLKSKRKKPLLFWDGVDRKIKLNKSLK